MKRFLAFILLLCHMNSSMFLPQMEEVDVFDANGQQLDDINSVVEYVYQVVLGNPDDTPEDEDDDSGQHFQVAKSVDWFYQQNTFLIDQTLISFSSGLVYSDFIHTKVTSISFDIITPPPEA